MKILVIYDSAFGNTEIVAKAIAGVGSQVGSIKLLLVGEVTATDLRSVDVLIVGSPTQGGMPTKATQEYLHALASKSLVGIKIAAFDTRFAISEHGIGLKVLMRTIGFAAPRIATILKQKGGEQVVKPEGFLVDNKEGPLKDGEIERAESWTQGILQSV